MKRLVLLVEGEYDGDPLCNLVNKAIEHHVPEGFGAIFTDQQTLRVGNLPKLSGRNAGKWLNYIRIALQRKDVGGVLAVIDGDEDFFEGRPMCAVDAARILTDRAREVGAGIGFSLAVVILLQEFESLLIAGVDQLTGYDGTPPPANIEVQPSGAKGWLDRHLADGYKPQADQLKLTQAIADWQPIRDRMRCFRRFESAVVGLVRSVIDGLPVLTPRTPPPPPEPK